MAGSPVMCRVAECWAMCVSGFPVVCCGMLTVCSRMSSCVCYGILTCQLACCSRIMGLLRSRTPFMSSF